MARGTRTVYIGKRNKELNSTFQPPEEGWSIQRPKRWDKHSDKDVDNYLEKVNDVYILQFKSFCNFKELIMIYSIFINMIFQFNFFFPSPNFSYVFFLRIVSMSLLCSFVYIVIFGIFHLQFICFYLIQFIVSIKLFFLFLILFLFFKQKQKQKDSKQSKNNRLME